MFIIAKFLCFLYLCDYLMSELKFASVFTKAVAFAQHRFSSFTFLFDCRLKRLLIEMNLNIDLKFLRLSFLYLFLLLNSFTRKNKPRPVKGMVLFIHFY